MERQSNITDEQRQRAEQNRLKAVEKLKKKRLEQAAAQSSSLPNPTGNFLKAPETSSQMKTVPSFYSKPTNIPPQVKQPLSKNDSSKIFQAKPSTVNLNANKIHATCSLVSKTKFKVQAPFNSAMIEIFKSTPNRTYDMNTKAWHFDISEHGSLINRLQTQLTSVTVSPLPSYILKLCKAKPSLPDEDLISLDPKLLDSLMPFQREGVTFGLHHAGRVLLADDMGLGKTIQSIAIASYYKEEWPLLVVCPSSVRYSWAAAFRTWLSGFDPASINIITSAKERVNEQEVVIISYDMMTRKKEDLDKCQFKVIIFDESHFLKSFKSLRFKTAHKISKHSNRIILLSGTPALSRPQELYTQINLVQPNLLGTFPEFGVRYCNGRPSPWGGLDTSGSSNMTELLIVLQETIMIRRLKSEVMSQLPSKQRQVIMLDPSAIKINKKQNTSFNKELAISRGMEQRGVLLRYFNESAEYKKQAVCNYLEDLLEADNKFICFAHHQVMLNSIAQLLTDKAVGFMRIDGSTASETRKLNCDRFQNVESCKVAVLSITAANAGINLTAASLVVFAELFWNPGILTQAEDRAHRIGQEDCVIVQYLVAEGTADDHIWPLIQKKLETLSKAGLSKDDFKESDTFKAPISTDQNIIEDYFDIESFMEDDDPVWSQIEGLEEPPRKIQLLS